MDKLIKLTTRAEEKSETKKRQAWLQLPILEGFKIVYKPYGENGRGFYYHPKKEVNI
jgi:hypothetical protein